MIQTICGNASAISRRRSSLTFLKQGSSLPLAGGSGARDVPAPAPRATAFRITRRPIPAASKPETRAATKPPDGNGLKREDGTRNRRSGDGTGGYDSPCRGRGGDLFDRTRRRMRNTGVAVEHRRYGRESSSPGIAAAAAISHMPLRLLMFAFIPGSSYGNTVYCR